ncbi:MAG: glycosyltransferase family 2 protein [Roseiflexaceae bacterium]
MFSVVVCAYTEARWNDLVDAVAALHQQTLQPEQIIVVVDHNPAMLERARRELAGAEVVANSGERGLSGARNSGIAAAHGRLIAFIDDDAIAAPDWLERMAAAFADPMVLGTGGAIVPAWPNTRPSWFPEEFDWVVGCTYRGMPEQPAPVRNVIGCNMAFRREVFDLIGGFRIGRVGTLSIGQENDETELCIRLGQARPEAVLLYLPEARVFHRVTNSRTMPSYYARRCFSEGLSKAALARQVGRGRGLSSERAYTMQTLPRGVRRGCSDALIRRQPAGLLRAGAIIGGLAVTAAGYLIGTARK